MMGPGEDPLGGSDLQNLAEIQSDDAIRDIARDADSCEMNT
jgi:hypothetical protein